MALLKDTLSEEHQSSIRWATHQLEGLLKELDHEGWEIDRNDQQTTDVVRRYAGIFFQVGKEFYDLAEEREPTETPRKRRRRRKRRGRRGQEDDYSPTGYL